MTKYIISGLTVLLAISLSFMFHFKTVGSNLKIENERLTTELGSLNTNYYLLADAFGKLSKQKTYQISLAPNITNKVNSTFGSTKQVTFQYYFSMDGNKMELLPDSTIILKK